MHEGERQSCGRNTMLHGDEIAWGSHIYIYMCVYVMFVCVTLSAYVCLYGFECLGLYIMCQDLMWVDIFCDRFINDVGMLFCVLKTFRKQYVYFHVYLVINSYIHVC